ncbi:MAG: TIGR03619 family F420-dependent LLM class oxidoreductase [Candidatus Rokubacteria bacterium]|nr:TIGR03619 family F420-dependent LLM class oxidoreductase [Candidatus Rokubacteria bacterium]
MKIGVNLINFGPGVTPEALLRTTQRAEGLGYHLAMISDHVAVTPDVAERYPAPFYEPFTALAWLAPQTRTIALGTTVIIVPYRHPLETARMTANLDRLMGGRLILGVGVGWARQEFDALGVPFTKRGALADEYLEAIKVCWTHDVASYAGRHVAFRDVDMRPRPLQAPHPPVWVGGNSDAALRRAVRYGDGWHPIRPTVASLRDDGLPRLRRIATIESRPVPALCPRIRLNLTDAPMPEAKRLAGQGTLDQVRGDLEGLEKLGAAWVVLDTFSDDVEATRDPAPARRWLEAFASKIFDLAKERLR